MNEMLHEQLSEPCLRKPELGIVKTLVNSGFSIPVREVTLWVSYSCTKKIIKIKSWKYKSSVSDKMFVASRVSLQEFIQRNSPFTSMLYHHGPEKPRSTGIYI